VIGAQEFIVIFFRSSDSIFNCDLVIGLEDTLGTW